MKKAVLSSFVIIAFICYALYQRLVGTGTNTLATDHGESTSHSDNSSSPSTNYKDGEYTGDAIDFLYGELQVKAVIQGGKITDVQFLQYPHDQPNSIAINQQAMPILKQEAIQAQSSQVDLVSGATDSWEAFQKSLASALEQAK